MPPVPESSGRPRPWGASWPVMAHSWVSRKVPTMLTRKAFARALTIAQSQGDVALECGRWPMLARYALTTARPQETIDVGLRAIELASRIDDPMHEATARYYTLLALAGNGDLEGARRHATVMLALAERLRDRQMLTNAYVANSLLCLLEGH